MVLRIITVGKISPWARKAYEHFQKMISRYSRMEHIALSTGGDLNRENAEVLKKREAEKIAKKIRGRSICLDKNGKSLSSEEFSKLLLNSANTTFVIGGPLGIHEDLLRKCELSISLSKMTLSHEVAFVTLLEQIFRGFKISRGEKYHY